MSIFNPRILTVFTLALSLLVSCSGDSKIIERDGQITFNNGTTLRYQKLAKEIPESNATGNILAFKETFLIEKSWHRVFIVEHRGRYGSEFTEIVVRAYDGNGKEIAKTNSLPEFYQMISLQKKQRLCLISAPCITILDKDAKLVIIKNNELQYPFIGGDITSDGECFYVLRIINEQVNDAVKNEVLVTFFDTSGQPIAEYKEVSGGPKQYQINGKAYEVNISNPEED